MKSNNKDAHRVITQVKEIPSGYVRMGRFVRRTGLNIHRLCRLGIVDSVKIMNDLLDEHGPVYVNADDVARYIRRRKARKQQPRRHREAISLEEAFDRLKPQMRIKFRLQLQDKEPIDSEEFTLV